MSKARYFGIHAGPGILANVHGLVPVLGQCLWPSILANVQGQGFDQYPGSGTLVNVKGQGLWPMSRAEALYTVLGRTNTLVV